MIMHKLTGLRTGATTPRKRGAGMASTGGIRAGLAVLAIAALGGCINVNAPEERIVIDLNINIQQEVVYRLAEDAANTIEENADIF